MKRNNEGIKRNTFKTQFFDGVVLDGKFEFPSACGKMSKDMSIC